MLFRSEAGLNGQIFRVDDWDDFWAKLDEVPGLPRESIRKMAARYDISVTEGALMTVLQKQLLR